MWYSKCAPSKYVYTLIPENSAYITLRGKLDSAVVIKLEALSWEIILNLTGESKYRLIDPLRKVNCLGCGQKKKCGNKIRATLYHLLRTSLELGIVVKSWNLSTWKVDKWD